MFSEDDALSLHTTLKWDVQRPCFTTSSKAMVDSTRSRAFLQTGNPGGSFRAETYIIERGIASINANFLHESQS